MSNPQKLPIDFKPEVSFTRSIDAVRALSENRMRRDVSAGYIVRERIPTAVRPNPPRQIVNPLVRRRFRPMSEWQVRTIGYAARSQKSLAAIRAERAARDKQRYATDPEFRERTLARLAKARQKAKDAK